MPSLSIQINKLRVTPDALSGKGGVANRLAVTVGDPANGTADSVSFQGTDGNWLDAATLATINGGYLVKDKVIDAPAGQDLKLQLFFFKEVSVPANVLTTVIEDGISLIPGWGSLVSSLVGLLHIPDHYEVPLGYREVSVPVSGTTQEGVELIAPQEERGLVFAPGAAKPTMTTLAARGAVTLAAGLTVTIA